MGEELVIW